VTVSAADADHLWALCGTGPPDSPRSTYLLASDDAGVSWTRLPRGAYGTPKYYSAALHAPPLVFVDASNGWSRFRPALSGTGSIEHVSTTSDGGLTWQSAHQPEVGADEYFVLQGFCALDERNAWSTLRSARGKASVLISTADGGQTWERNALDDRVLLGVYFSDSDHGWVAVVDRDRNLILGTSDGGQHWTEELVVGSGNSSRINEWVFCRTDGSLYASNGMVLLSRAIQ
jgi:photosystem II stability/assembly factor-like uncharacterized protein